MFGILYFASSIDYKLHVWYVFGFAATKLDFVKLILAKTELKVK